MTKIIGLTGGMGSGKTTVAKMFEELGIPVYYADDKAKELMQRNKDLQKKLIAEFGDSTYKNGELNTGYLAKIVFSNPDKLKKLENWVHPAVRNDFIKWTKNKTSPYVIVENAILHKTGMDQLTDNIIWVIADKKKRMERITIRDKMKQEDIQKRMDNQNFSPEMMKNSHFIIKNNKDIEFLRNSVQKIDQKLKKMLKKG